MAATKVELSGTTDAGFRTFTYKWTIKNLGNLRSDISLYSDPFEMEIVSWQAVFKCVDGKAECGLKYLGYYVMGPCLAQPAEFSCSKDDVLIFGPINRVFCSKSDEQCEDISNHLESTMNLAFSITTRIPGYCLFFIDDLSKKISDQFRNYSNILLKVGDPPIAMMANKQILGGYSRVFGQMFKEEEDSVTISNIDVKTFTQLIKFMYTGRVDMAETEVDSLLVAADEYEISTLKTACEYFIFRTVSVSTAIDRLIFAEKYCADQLKENLLDFIRQNFDGVMAEGRWKTLVTHPQLVVEMHHAMAKK